MSQPEVTVVIPVYNEEAGLQALFDRLYPALDALGKSYEVLFVNDGSRDRSAGMLAAQYEKRPDVTRVILLNGNFGQHRAILAGFENARGLRIVTMDADLQNPPEDVGTLLAEMDKGHDYVGSIRRQRNDSVWRHVASRAMNHLREKLTKIKMTDQGCMLRAYDRRIIDLINQCAEMHTFIPALAYSFSQNPTEVIVGHEERHAGESKYSLYSLIRLNFDLMTGFSIVPLQAFSMLGMVISFFSAVLVLVLIGRRIFVGPEVGGLFTLFAIAFFLIGITLFGIGILGEYIGRIYHEVRQRPRYLISAILEKKDEA
ncbi:undecaprenyl-phosphate 4-deoxy-4-formamido-L-arabinose transferase [Silvimonas terrae]|uniref:Undecaprenyl-phosphate 4-deoxy-4-formamido-L-arabinose transferase n=1 Tax=Silvimonas terrae TaxID=300266 RepID=A0A840RAU1_9NEIS|nr:glycosyltransferase [Silvimonas terrae]MBB5190027.1 undecaprenyl-phosphate 4-deoxy-4-formamido-L-arabinose transferase [Silvimonas terrae]